MKRLKSIWTTLVIWFFAMLRRESLVAALEAHAELHRIRNLEWEIKALNCAKCQLWLSALDANPENRSVFTDHKKENT